MHLGGNCEYYLALHLPFLPLALIGLLCFCYVFTLSWCSSLTNGAATEPRASYVLQPYACATRCALVSWSVITTPWRSILYNLNIVLTWVLNRSNKNSGYLHNPLGYKPALQHVHHFIRAWVISSTYCIISNIHPMGALTNCNNTSAP